MARTTKNTILFSIPEEKRPYHIPDYWCWVSIESINQYNAGSIDPAKQPDRFFELYSVPSSADNYPEIVQGKEIGSTKQEVKKGDVLLCKINPRINRVWVVSQHTENSLLASSEWIIVRNDMINSDYLMYCFRSPYFREYMLSNVSGVGGSLMRAQPKHVKKYPIPIPPLVEQQRIVNRIESLFAKLDEAKEKAQAVVDSFENRKVAILHRAFTGELTKQWRYSRNHTISQWEWLKFEECIDTMQNGIAKRKGDAGEPYVVLRLANLSVDGFIEDDLREIILDEKEQKNYELHPEDVIMIRVNGSKDNVGKQYRITNQRRWAFCDHIIRIKYSDRVLPQYMVYFSKTRSYRQYINDNMVSSAGQNTISRKGMAKLLIPLPGKPEQIQIVTILDSLFEKEKQAKEAAEQFLSAIDIMKKSILARAFRGELGTNDLANESGEEMLKQKQ